MTEPPPSEPSAQPGGIGARERRWLLGFRPRVAFADGMSALVEWLEGQQAVDRVDAATRELAARGLTR